jgi:hypothetical protein
MIIEHVNVERAAELGSVSIEVGDEDVPTYPVDNCDGLHIMARRQERRQSDVKMCDKIIALFLLRSVADTGSGL